MIFNLGLSKQTQKALLSQKIDNYNVLPHSTKARVHLEEILLRTSNQ